MLRFALVGLFLCLPMACASAKSPLRPPAEPAVFAPGVVSTRHNELNAALAPDGSMLVFSITDPADQVATLLITRPTKDGWAPPTIAPFSGRYSDVDPSFSPNGRTLYFSSRRPLSGNGAAKDADLWAVDRTREGWGAPRNLGPTINTSRNDWHVTSTRNGVLYYSTWDDTRKTDDIFRAVPKPDGGWEVKNLGAPVNTGQVEGDPFISADERYLIFVSYRGGGAGSSDLYVSFRNEDGSWTAPEALRINTEGREYCPAVTVDGGTFFYTQKRPTAPRAQRPSLKALLESYDEIENSAGNVYWMKADFIDKLDPRAR